MHTCYKCGKPIEEAELEWTYGGGWTLKPVHKQCYLTEVPVSSKAESEESESEESKTEETQTTPKTEVTGDELRRLPDFFAKIIYNRMYDKAKEVAIDWATHVVGFIEVCEKRGGIPMFRTRYAGQRFPDPEHPGKYMVLGICYGHEIPRLKGVWFDNVPLDDVERLESD